MSPASPFHRHSAGGFLPGTLCQQQLSQGVGKAKIGGQTHYGQCSHVDELADHVDFIGHSAVRTGRNVIHDDVNTIVYGSENTADIENVQRVKEYFDLVGINYKIPDDIMHSLWLKYMLNVSANQSTAILRLTFGEMLANDKCMEFVNNFDNPNYKNLLFVGNTGLR